MNTDQAIALHLSRMPAQRDTVAKGYSDAAVSTEVITFFIDPHQSYVPAAFAHADPDFWKTNPVVVAMANGKSGAVKQAGAERKKD